MAMQARAHQFDDDERYDDGDVIILSAEEGVARFDEEARKVLGISGEEFLRRWDAGEVPPVPDTPEGWPIARLVMMLPLVRHIKI
ncbi:MAG: hypothetical protein KC442_00700 [Thermomicrobiales bacterium]|nr:hypothetical protein [Thermomicrobiales bacterium]